LGTIEEQLFDLGADPDERRNLAHETSSRAQHERMRERLRLALKDHDLPENWWEPNPPRGPEKHRKAPRAGQP